MPATRSGKEFSGLSQAQTAIQLESYEFVKLNCFDMASLVRPAQLLQTLCQDREVEPPLRHYDLRPRPKASKSYQIMPISDLAKYRPKLNTHASDKHQRKDYDVKSDRKTRSLAKKRRSERAARAKKRGQRLEELETDIKGFQRRHVQKTQAGSISIDVNVSDIAAESSAWCGTRDEHVKKEMTLEQVKQIQGMRVLEYDGSKNLLIRDSQDRPVALMAKDENPADTPLLLGLFQQAMVDLKLTGSEISHRRGRYFTKIFGISFGGGQQRPGNFAHTANEDAVWDRLRNTPEVQAVARRIDCELLLSSDLLLLNPPSRSDLLACYFPKLHNLYTNTLRDLCDADKALSPNFEHCCFAAASINLDHAVTVYHHDWRNWLFGQCAVKSFGPFDYKKGGHLVLWDLKLIIEFPPGCTAFLPSALLAHSNTSIGKHERRYSMTFFTASGLLRWRHNNYMSDKDFTTGAPRPERQAWEEHRDNLWRTGLDLLSDL